MSATSAPDEAMHRFGVQVGEVPARLFIASDGHELCLWEGDPTDSAPRCVERESDVDPIVWSLIVRSLHVEIPRDTKPIVLDGPTLADGLGMSVGAPSKCTACHGRRERLHGWAICPAPCRDCGGTGVAGRAGRAS